MYHEPTGTWNRVALSVNRNLYAVAALNNKLLVGGGYAGTNNYTGRVDVFDLATGQVTTPSLSQPRGALAAAGAGNKILFAGGYTNANVFSTVDIYNTQTGAWTKDSLSLARAALTAGSAGNKIVFAGGMARNGNTNVLSNRVDIYDVQTGAWTQSTISQPRAYMTSISVGNKIFFAGGTAGNVYPETVDIYDVQANKWTTVTLTGNILSVVKMTTNGSQVFFFSGNITAYTKMHIYDLATANFTTMPLPQAAGGFGIAAIGNKLLMAGGSAGNGVSNRLLLYDIKANTFDSTSYNIGEKKHEPTAATIGNRVLIAGGVWDGKNASNVREVINYKQVRVYELK